MEQILHHAFCNCDNLKEILIPASVNVIKHMHS